MTATALLTCRLITEQFLERPLNVFFKSPVDPEADGLPGYNDRVSRPMDLGTVLSNLDIGEYRSTADWHRDMCLIYENAIAYHTESSTWGLIAAQLLHDFKRLADGFQCRAHEDWTAILSRATQKLGKVLVDSPIRRGKDSLAIACVRRAEGMNKFPAELVPELIEKLKGLMSDADCRWDVLMIIKSVQRKDPPITTKDGESTVEVEKLRDQTMHALNMYARSLV